MMENLMLKFIRDRVNLKSFQHYVAYSTEERPHLTIAHPAILATFMGYLKFQNRIAGTGREIFFRGETNIHKHVIPSLLRNSDIDRVNLLAEAYEELKIRTRKSLIQRRFKDETLDNIFQHYGIRSTTLDLVDNIYIAVWFATNSWKRVGGFDYLCTYEPSKEEFGWIYFMAVESPQNSDFSDPQFTGYCNLREYHSSLSARLHCQHGITYFKNNHGAWNEYNKYFDDLVIAIVKIPNSPEFKMDGTIFTKEFLFPNSEIDNTYKVLRSREFTDLLKGVEKDYALQRGELGQIWTYNF